MFGFFKRREEVFHKLIQEQASITFDGLKLLVKYLETEAPEIAEQLALKEKEADEVRRILIDELNRRFVTPFDREDIFALSRSIDDVIDYADSTLSEMVVLKVKPTPYMQRMATLLKDAAYEIYQAVLRLQKNPPLRLIMHSVPKPSRIAWRASTANPLQTFSADPRTSITWWRC